MRIGVLAVQGAVAKHLETLGRCGVEGSPVRTPEEIERLDGLILPGGESTTIGKLMDRYGLVEPIRRLAAAGKALLGTCAGLILMAKEIRSGVPGQPRLSVMDITVERNAFGRQIDSFEADIDFTGIEDGPVKGVFICAPTVSGVGDGVEVLARHGEEIVAVRQGKLLAISFHPELTDDLRLHKYFVSLAESGG